MEVMEGCPQCGALVLADPMAKGVAEVNRESIGGPEQDVVRSTEGEG